MKRIYLLICTILLLSISLVTCTKRDENPGAASDKTEITDTTPDDPSDNPDDKPSEDPADEPEDTPSDNPEDGPSDNPEPEGPVEPQSVTVLDPGAEPDDSPVYPSHPDLVRETEITEFYDNVYDWLDDWGNVDYVVSQGFGTAWPIITDNGHLLLYQAKGSKGGSYIRLRSKYDAHLLKVEIGSVGTTSISYSLNGKAARSAKKDLEGGSHFTFVPNPDQIIDEICFYCEGTTVQTRWEVDYIKVTYSGGYTEEDFVREECEYGPLVRVSYPYTENFESETYPVTEKNTYMKYGLQAGPDNLQWSTWYGCFSWQHPKGCESMGEKSPQLRIYQEDADYDQSQFGYLKMEFFLEGLTDVEFDWYFSEFWINATIAYCEFGSSEWKGAQRIALENYSDRQTLRHFHYTLDAGRAHDAKIGIFIDPSSGHPTKDHYDMLFDNFVFNPEK